MKRQCEILGIPEETELAKGMDFRLPQYRREVFLRFYEFHLQYRTHPGCVYFAIPWLKDHLKLDQEQLLWLAFLNGNTQNIVTSYLIFKRFSGTPSNAAELAALTAWFTENYPKLEWDTDRRYHKKDFLASVACYMRLTGGNQRAYFQNLTNFDDLWKVLRRDFYTFGRLSAFSYSEYLRIAGLAVDCPTLFLEDLSGSKSHRNGLAKVLGRDDLDWHKSTGFDGSYKKGEIAWLEEEGHQLLAEAKQRTAKNKEVDPAHVNYFTLESALCTYKSWHRPNRRYANVYADMFHGRILRAQQKWGNEVSPFWLCRKELLPKHLRIESNSLDPGLVPEKQNHYRVTGEVIMMSKRWPEFDNPFDRKIWDASSC